MFPTLCLYACTFDASPPHQIRFDPVYVGHFKCNLRTIRDGYPAIDL